MRENHPRHRQALKALRKQEAKRGRWPRVLLGCEGATERLYFDGFRRSHALPSLTLVFAGEGSDPGNLLEKVCRKFTEEEGDFQEVFCVFDRDEHARFESTCQRILDLGRLRFKRCQASIEAVVSDPCFELWLLLHFEDLRAAIHRDEALKRLRKHCHAYEKADAAVYDLTCSQVEVAFERAARLERGKNPSTAAGELIRKLKTLWRL